MFALLAVAIPVLIHLFNFRRYKTVYFSNVGFLKEIKRDSRKKIRLKHILILLARILAIIFLVLAFARPYIPSPGSAAGGGGETVAVYLDNSFSMNAMAEKGKLLEQARNKAVEIAGSYPPGAKFKLFTNDLQPKHNYSFNKEQFIKEVSGIAESPSGIPLSMIFNRFAMQDQESGDEERKTIYFISDFQKNITDPDNFSGSPVQGYFIPMRAGRHNNLYIDSCWVEEPAHGLKQEENIFVRIVNSSEEDYSNLPLKLYLNDSLKSITNFSVAANDEIITNLRYTNVSEGMQLGRIEITDYPFTHDNTWYISYYVLPKLKSLAIYCDHGHSTEGLGYLSSLFKDDDYVKFESMNIQNLQISKLAEYNAIFLVNIQNFTSGFLNELVSVVSNGVSVVLFPYTGVNPLVSNTMLAKFKTGLITRTDSVSQRISGINFEHRFFSNVFFEKKEDAVLPQIDRHLKFEENMRANETNLLWFQNGDKALSVASFDKGKVWIFSFSLEKKNEEFARDILFVPSVYNIVLNSLPDQQISYTIGRDQTILLPKSIDADMESNIEITEQSSGTSFIPGVNITSQGTRLDIAGMIRTAGHYLIQNSDTILMSLAYNYNRNESDFNYFTDNELDEKIKYSKLDNVSVISDVESDFTEVIARIRSDKQLGTWCIMFALIFIVAEVLISRFWK